MSDFSVSRAGHLKGAGDNKEQQRERVAKQFEALFIGMLTKQGRIFGSEEGAIFGQSAAEKNYQELMDNALAENSAGG